MASSKRLSTILSTVLLGACAPVSGPIATALSQDTLARLQLRRLDGEPFDLRAVTRGHHATVLVWWASRCPCVRRYQHRMEALAKAYGPRNVAVFAVASNADDSQVVVSKEARKRRIEVPLLIDRGGQLASALSVRTTPTTVILTANGQVAFHGSIDNERLPGQSGRRAYAEKAIVAVLAGRQPATSRTPTYGCLITRRIGETTRCSGPPARKVATRTPATQKVTPKYEVLVDQPSPVRLGQQALGVVHVRVKGHYKVTPDYPAQLSIRSGSRKLLRTRAQAKITTRTLSFEAPLSFTEIGDHSVTGTLRFSICDKERCFFHNEPVKWTVTVTAQTMAADY